jgi:hypothetical protein
MAMVRRRFVALALGGAIIGGAGCGKSYEQGVREAHGREFSCPVERITARARPDVDAHDATFGPSTPPDEVKRDPARLAIWKKQQRETHDLWNSHGEVWEASGCGHDVVYQCGRPNGKGQNGFGVSCSALNHQPGKK